MENKHYYRLDGNGLVVYGFSDAFEQPIEGDMLVESGGRQFNPVISNDRGQYILKVVDGAIVERTTEELDAEWSARPPEPKTPDQLRIEQLETQLAQQNSDNITFTEFILQTLGVE